MHRIEVGLWVIPHREFEKEYLKPLPDSFDDCEELIKHVAHPMLNFFSFTRFEKEMDVQRDFLQIL